MGDLRANPVEFYCGCRNSGNQTNLASCGYVARKNPQVQKDRAGAYHAHLGDQGHQRQCRQNGGRSNGAKEHDLRRAEANLHNLVPALAGSTATGATTVSPGCRRSQRSSSFHVVDFTARDHAAPTDTQHDRAHYFYMADRYKLRLSKQDRQLFNAWSKTNHRSRGSLCATSESRAYDAMAMRMPAPRPDPRLGRQRMRCAREGHIEAQTLQTCPSLPHRQRSRGLLAAVSAHAGATGDRRRPRFHKFSQRVMYAFGSRSVDR